ncbi:MAG: M48 family metalloprotease [Phycisphaeraceae bacterium]|nr:M48 family metalloprotease [Phycisphaeraceae bacterium]
MIQILVISLAIGIFLHDAVMPADPAAMRPWLVALVVLGPMLLLAVWVRWICRRRISLSGRTLRGIDRQLAIYRFALLPCYAGQLYVGSLLWVRRVAGDLVLVDELLVMLPTIGMLAWAWWCYYPIDRRLREAALIASLDQGKPIYPIWSRWRFLTMQLRHQVLLMLVPLVAILAWVEAAGRYILPLVQTSSTWSDELIMAGGAMGIFLLSPLMIRYTFDTVPLPAGEIRDHLAYLCKLHRVRVRGLLLWRTFGGVINAAVMGVIAPLRYVMISDGLLDHMPKAHVEAVMCHELAHVRKHHMFWLLAFAVSIASALDALLSVGWGTQSSVSISLVAALLLAALAWVIAFGWASRRIERQADAYAVAHLAREKTLEVIDETSAEVMIHALGHVAHLNHINPTARSWRHGSIRSRQLALRRLIHQPLTGHSADRAVAAVQWSTILLALAAVAIHLR